ncbi:hypothetical protein [Sphingobacterium siyangense]|uniref:hypothetical protein n=1 Tax=Sphingobacterium siyangense TaxID=459529 RepID=UPI0019654BFA|nr:hypothetical protein [Sphingobacterium siyangense]QRY57101.1 hypothetical protein JVX97_24415 [Sphingobacterium siyangense]
MVKRKEIKILQLFTVIFCVFFLSCSHYVEKKLEAVINDSKDLELPRKVADSLWRRAINAGDFKAYNEVSNNYLLILKIPELYYYAQLMANRQECPEAYLHLYILLTSEGTMDGIELAGRDSLSRSQALFYLLRAYELGEENAVSYIHKEFGHRVRPPKSITYLKKIQKFIERKK